MLALIVFLELITRILLGKPREPILLSLNGSEPQTPFERAGGICGILEENPGKVQRALDLARLERLDSE